MSDEALVNGVLQVIKDDNVDGLKAYIEKEVAKDIQFPPELDSEPEFLRNGAPLICAAAYFGSVNCVKYLVEIGADKSNADDDGMTAPFYAAAGGKPGMLEELKALDFDITGCGQACVRFGHLDLFKDLLAKGVIKIDDRDLLGSNYLHIASFNGNAEFVEFLLHEKLPANSEDREGRTGLHLAAGNGFFNVCELLLKNGGDPTKPDKYGKSPMHYAAVQEEFPIIELFLGGDVNGIHSDGMTPLMRAATEGKAALCQLLLEIEKVDPNLKNPDGMTALHLAIKSKQTYTAKLLVNNSRVDKNCQDEAGNTPMHWATRKLLMDVVELLLKKGAKIDIKNKGGKTPLQDVDIRLQRPPKPPGD